MNPQESAILIENITKEYRLGVLDRSAFKNELRAKFRAAGETSVPPAFRTIRAVDNLSLRIKKGERVGIIGRNGAGKSTLLKMICRITEPTQGRISINGKVTSLLEVGVGFHPELTGRENIYLSGSILGMSRDRVNAELDQIVDFSGIRDFLDTPVKRYSLGMYMRLAFAVSAHLNADILILDEVLSVGDAEFRRKCIDKLLDLAQRENKTILYVSHNMETVRALCNRCVVMDSGKIQFDGDVRQATELALANDRNE